MSVAMSATVTRSRIIGIALAMTLVTAATPCFGQPSSVVRPTSLTQRQAVQLAVGQHPSLTAAAQAVKAAQARTSQTQTAWLPRVKLEASYMLIGPLQELEIDTGLTMPGQTEPVVVNKEMGSLHNLSVGLSAGWRAFEAGARAVRTDAARALEQAARAKADQQASQVAYAVRASYLAARFFQEVEGATAGSKKVAEGELASQRIRRKAGLGNDLDLARAQSRVAQLDAQLVRAQQERLRALSTLRLLLGLPANANVTLLDDLKSLGSAALVPRASTQLHPVRKQIDALQRATEAEHARLGRTYWPTIDVVGTVKYQYPKSPFHTDEAGPAFAAGAVLKWNVFDGDLTRRRRNETEAKIAGLKAQQKAATSEIGRKRADAQAKISTATSAVAAAQRILKAAKVYQRAAEASLEAGTGTRLELSQASDAVDQGRLAVLKAHFDGGLGRAAYLLADGRSTDSPVAKKEPRR